MTKGLTITKKMHFPERRGGWVPSPGFPVSWPWPSTCRAWSRTER